MTEVKTISQILTALLNSLGLDEEQRKRRMACEKMSQILCSTRVKLRSSLISSWDILSSGSTFETTTIDGLSSDIDVMVIDTHMRIIADIKDWRYGDMTFIMNNTGCNGGFAKLYFVSPHAPILLTLGSDVITDLQLMQKCGFRLDENGYFVLSNTYIHLFCGTGEIHGPAITTPGSERSLESDLVYTFRCESFPKEAMNWKTRQTPVTRTRIDPGIIDDINHCYLVGVGDKTSPNEQLEWRLSFSHIENELVHTWNNTQYQCYVLMKFIQKDLIKPFVPDILCSYHSKTLIMWMNEEYPTEFFVSSQFEHCALTCLRNLAESARKRSLPHYFVEGCNLFHPKLTNNNSIAKKLVHVIENIVATWPQCLFNISRCNLGRMLHDCLNCQSVLPTICTRVHERRRREGRTFEMVMEQNWVCLLYYQMRNAVLKNRFCVFSILSNLYGTVNSSSYNEEHKQFMNFIIKDILCNIGLNWIQCENSAPNKIRLRNLRSGSNYIQRYSKFCCIDTGLKIAAHFVTTGQYHRALTFLNKVENQVMNYTSFYCFHDGCYNYMHALSREAVYDNKPSMMEFCKNYNGKAVTYNQKAISNVPKGLVYEMFRSTSISPLSDPRLYDWHQETVIHCPLYMYYLRFLCHQAQGLNAHRQVALDNMEWAARQLSANRGTHQETNHNIIGHCHRSSGNTRRAYKEYRKSLEIEKYNNAVLWHLAVLLRGRIRDQR